MNGLQSYVFESNIFGMTDGQSPCRLDAMSRRLGITASLMSADNGLAIAAKEKWVAVALLLHIVKSQPADKPEVDIA